VSGPYLYQRTTDDFWKAFEIHKSALDVSSLAFDGGLIGEAARLATSAFLFVGRGMGNHKSILDHLGITDSVQFPTTVPDGSQSGTPLIHASLTCIRKDEWVIELVPNGRAAMQTGRTLKFDDWWNEKVLDKGKGQKLSRKDIIRILRDRDGGAHYDANVKDPLVGAALQGQITGFLYKNPDGHEVPIPNPLETTMRQIAEELRQVLRYLRFQHDPSIKDKVP
jgi:hypothetical protein